MPLEELVARLPILNAGLNATAATCLVLAYRAIRRGDRLRHARFMIGAFCASTIFLVSYLTRFALAGTTRFPLDGAWRAVYFVILVSHMLLAIPLLPMVLRTLYLARAARFAEHRRLARWTFPVWAYVSVTGVVVYLMLHQLPSWR